MDKFLIKTPRDKPDKDITTASSSKTLKQSTIHSLQGVVVIEDIRLLKSKLELSGQSKSVMLESLKELGKKNPPRSVLLSTKIGHTVRKLKKHPDEDVAREAKKVFSKWKGFLQDSLDRPQIEVKCDKKTENLRLRGKTFLSGALGVERTHELVEAIEREAFHQHKRLASPAYRRSIRTMVFKLKHTEALRTSILNRSLTVEDFVKQHKKS